MGTMHKAAFLGPKAENADELERLLLEVLHDHVFWRRNFHPQDERLVREGEKRTEDYGELIARLRDELFQILAELKRGAPLYSPRQIAHMVSDPTMPSLIGYFAGMLYNQNNVVAEVAPETVRKERAYLAALARMIAYPSMIPARLPRGSRSARYSWGHLTSGGTVANIEALWVARNVRFFAPAVRLLAAQHEAFAHLGRLSLPGAGLLSSTSTSALFGVSPADVVTLQDQIADALESGEAAAAFEALLPDVRRCGLAGFTREYNAAFPGDEVRLPKVYLSRAAHYSWEKAMDLTGLGMNGLVFVPVDRRIRMNVDLLEERLWEDLERGEPVLAVVSICGTTEECAVDPVHLIEGVRVRMAGAGLAFWHHCDAALGGFFASMIRRGPVDSGEAAPGLSEDVLASLRALAGTDSVTIDPHKLGYVPYPAGAVLFSDYRFRDFSRFSAPYLGSSPSAGFGGFLGGWTLEGSRPGAAAVSCYLSEAILPLTPEGHGRLMQNCIAACTDLVAAITRRFERGEARLDLHPLAERDTIGFCFFVAPRSPDLDLAALNRFNESIWEHFTVGGRVAGYSFLFSKTEIDVEAYAHVLSPLLEKAEAAATGARRLTLMRLLVMHPFASEWREGGRALSERVAEALYQASADVLARTYYRQ